MLSIRPEQPSDAPAIRAIHVTSFPTDAEARLVDLLREAGNLSVSLVAAVHCDIVGHVAFSLVRVSSGRVGAGLAPVAVLPTHRGQGIAALLVRAGLAECRSAGLRWAVVLGNPAYYSRFGFQPASDFGLSDEYGGGTAFQVIALVPGAMPSNNGVVRYAPQFAALA
jgi:putative acetyltransferase